MEEDLKKFTYASKAKLAEVREATYDATPFLYTLGARALKGGAFGLGFGLLCFSSRSMRRFSVLYGAGVGLGMSYSQVYALKGAFFGTAKKTDEAFYREIDSIQQEIELRNKLR